MLDYAQQSLGSWTALRFVRAQDVKLIDNALLIDTRLLEQTDKSAYLERIRTLPRLAASIIERMLPAAAQSPFMILYAYIIIRIGGFVVVPSLFAVAIELFVSLFLRKRILAAADRAEVLEKDRIRFVTRILDRIHFIKAQALEYTVMRSFEHTYNSHTEAESQKKKLMRLIDSIDRVINSAAVFGTIIWGGMFVTRGTMTVGAVSACLFFAMRLAGGARDVRKTVFAVSDAEAETEELFSLFELQKRPGAGNKKLPPSVEGRVEFSNVSYTDPVSHDQLLKDVSFVLRPRQSMCVSLQGSSGFERDRAAALCRLAAGLSAPETGQVLIDAYPGNLWDFQEKAGNISYISSRSRVLPGTILENISAFNHSRIDGALDMAELLGLDKAVSRLPRGYETRIGPKTPGGLSSSDLRIVTITRALSVRPRILVWDNADSDLDSTAREKITAILASLKNTMTIIMNSADADICRVVSAGSDKEVIHEA